MWVVKLGGSLAHDEALLGWLKVLCQPDLRQIVIVPGGGLFADQVRQAQSRWCFSERAAHDMAILAMHQMGTMFAALAPGLTIAQGVMGVRKAIERGRTAVWLPDPSELGQEGVPASWDVTSDSLAAWLSGKLAVRDLILVKSLMPPSQEPAELQRLGIVDPAFMTWFPDNVRFRCYHRNQFRSWQRDFGPGERLTGAREMTPR